MPAGEVFSFMSGAKAEVSQDLRRMHWHHLQIDSAHRSEYITRGQQHAMGV